MRRLRRSWTARTAVMLLCAAACGATFWQGNSGWLLWLTFVPYWGLSQDGGPGRAFLLGWLMGCVGWATATIWFPGAVLKFVPNHPLLAGLIYVALLAGMGSMFGALACAVRALALALRERAGWDPGLAFLAASVPGLVAFEGFYPQLFPATLAVSQFWHLPIVQSADLLGPSVVVWLVGLWSASSSLLLRVELGGARRGPSRRAARAAWGASLLLLAANEGYGLVRLGSVERALSAAAPAARRAAVVQASVPDEQRFRPERFQANLETMRALTRRAAGEGARLVVWPENTYERDLYYDRKDASFADPREAGGAPLPLAADVPVPVDVVVGGRAWVTEGPPESRRRLRRYYLAVLKRADGSYGGFSSKGTPTPFGEYIPGGRFFPGLYKLAPFLVKVAAGPQPVLRLSDGTGLGAFICYDAARPYHASRLARRGAELLSELTSNAWWFDDTVMPEQTLRMTRLRAIETRRYVLRALTTGVSAVIDPAGRVLASVPFGGSGVAAADVIPLKGATLEVRLGLAGYAAGAMALAALTGLAWAGGRCA